MPSCDLTFESISVPKNIILADPEFQIPDKIDILLGAGIFWKILLRQKIDIPNSNLKLCESEFGWIISGPLSIPNVSSKQYNLQI